MIPKISEYKRKRNWLIGIESSGWLLEHKTTKNYKNQKKLIFCSTSIHERKQILIL